MLPPALQFEAGMVACSWEIAPICRQKQRSRLSSQFWKIAKRIVELREEREKKHGKFTGKFSDIHLKDA